MSCSRATIFPAGNCILCFLRRIRFTGIARRNSIWRIRRIGLGNYLINLCGNNAIIAEKRCPDILPKHISNAQVTVRRCAQWGIATYCDIIGLRETKYFPCLPSGPENHSGYPWHDRVCGIDHQRHADDGLSDEHPGRRLVEELRDALVHELALTPRYVNLPRKRVEAALHADQVDLLCDLRSAWLEE